MRPSPCWLPVLAGLAGAWLTATATAQSLPANPPLPPVAGAPAPPAPSGDPEGLPPYEPQLEQLAERLGTLALLRELCGDGDAAEFRNRMAALIEAEAHTSLRRNRLAGAFNRGYHGYAASYRSCTPSAQLVIARSLSQVDKLTHDLAARYGGG